MKTMLLVAAAMYVAASAAGCNCLRQRGSACPPTCISAPVCCPTTGFSDCCSTSSGGTVISGGTMSQGSVVESFGSPTPAGTVVTPGPVTYAQ